jgi:hypothetical protein
MRRCADRRGLAPVDRLQRDHPCHCRLCRSRWGEDKALKLMFEKLALIGFWHAVRSLLKDALPLGADTLVTLHSSFFMTDNESNPLARKPKFLC